MSSELRALWESAGGKLPEDCSVVPLETLLAGEKSIAVGVMYPGDHTPGGVPLIKVGDIKNGEIPVRPVYCISAETNYEYRRTQLSGDELLITLVGNPGECVLVQPHMAGWNPARAIAVLKLKDVELRTYLKAILESSAGKHLIDAVLNTTVQKTLNLKDIRRLPVPLPSRRSILEISSISEALTDRVTLLRQTNATLEAIAQALFKSWFVDFDPVRAKMEGRVPEGMDDAMAAMFPDGLEESELGRVPRGWRTKTINDICRVITNGGTPSRANPQFWSSGVIPWYKTGELNDGFLLAPSECITDAALEKSAAKVLPKDAVLMAIYAAPTVGRLGILVEDAAFNQACTGMVAKEEVGPWFLYWSLFFGRHWFNNRANGAAQQNISKAIVSAYRITVPPPPVLSAFHGITDAIHRKICANSVTAHALATVRDTLLPRLISGQLRVDQAEDALEPA